MSEQYNMGELTVEVLDLTRRLSRIEDDQVRLDSRLKNIEEQVTIFNANMKRFWERDWPTLEVALKFTNEKLDAIAKDTLDEKVRIALETAKDKQEIVNLREKTKILDEDVKSQRSLLVKLLASAAGGGASVVALVEAIQHLFTGAGG